MTVKNVGMYREANVLDGVCGIVPSVLQLNRPPLGETRRG
jgi:hypothetical protein